MILTLENGQVVKMDSQEVLIVPLPDKTFNINDPTTWESDRAWIFAKPGTTIWTGKGNETSVIRKVL